MSDISVEPTLSDLERATQLSAGRELMADRATELGEYFKMPADDVTTLYKAYHVDKIKRPPAFDGASLATILASYTNPQVMEAHLTRLMLHYTRLGMAFNLLAFFNAVFPAAERGSVRVVDYGCGAADFGLAFAVNGYHVTLLDIEGGKIEFASWRFRRRNLPFDAIAINEAHEYPDFSGADIVVAGDVLEHLRDPRQGIRAVHRGLKPKGFFWFPDFPFKEKSVGGDHLPEAAALREASGELMNELFQRAAKVKHLMRRKD